MASTINSPDSLNIQTNTVNAISIDANQNVTILGSLINASWTTATRPASPVAGQQGFNTTTGYPEWYDSSTSSWIQFNQANFYPIDYLIVAGGGGGNGDPTYGGGGGGAGGYLSGTTTATVGTAYSLVVGAGGAYGAVNGQNSTGFSLTALGGGSNAPIASTPGASGGSGSGGSCSGTFAGGSGTSGQGNAGGSSLTTSGVGHSGGGGGGASASGSNGSGNVGAKGGDGTTWVNGSTYAGGGGASGNTNAPPFVGAGGAGGGGAGGVSGTANTGGGGGGSGSSSGGSGIVIVRYAGAQRGTGGTVTSSGGFTYHTFTTSGTFTG